MLESDRLVAAYVALLLLVPLTAACLARPYDLYARFFAYWFPYYLILIAAGLRTLWDAAPRAAVATRPLAALCVAVVLATWTVELPARIPNAGYRETTLAALSDDPSVGFCAIGGARSVWHHYVVRPIATPASVDELQSLARRFREVRCFYYRATWQDAQQTAIADFLRDHGAASRINDELSWFRYRRSE